MPQLATWIASSVQVCGLYPFTIGSARPAVGVPLGADLTNWSLVYGDPVTWFMVGFISNPSAMIFGLPGLGKSTLVIRWLIGLADRGYPPMVLGDIKGEYSATIRALGGEVIEVAPGKCTINPLDLGALMYAAKRIGGEVGASLIEQAIEQSSTLVIALARLVRGKALQDYEETLVTLGVQAAHQLLDDPDLRDLIAVIEAGTANPELMSATVSYSTKQYQKATMGLLRTLRSILQGPMGVMFNGKTTVQIRMDNPGGVSVDLSGMRRADKKVLAGVMIATWAHGFAAMDAQWELAKAFPETEKCVNPFVVQDELWKPMSLAPGLAGLIDQVARTNRHEGVAEVRITHSPKDAQALPTREDRVAAMGFAEKAGMLVLFGLAKNDLRALDDTSISLNEKEFEHVASWRSPRSFRTRRNRNGRPKPPPGAGKALIKVAAATGIAVQTVIVAEEVRLHDTNERWTQPKRRRTRDEESFEQANHTWSSRPSRRRAREGEAA
ncbi:ATP/GTP-binding protein [Plantibacter sp. CFBP 8804]|uniref:ATP/GTP-binding protein n=1 Tax=Plantibacter sp. CFBP 8804 TaxID=2775270 RepID=UPI00177BCE09|nr:ATP/GTP-binding protein [Plantibacter sp. CFBP 8804]MBD8519140.1 ATP/GTP-binding protein [Plantibacter sp. CFBP 8804]